MTESVEKENDSSSTEMNDDSDKNETESIKLLCLMRFGDRAREVVGHHGMGMEDLLALAEQVSIKKTACGICCDRPKNAFLLPCGHTLCMPCATHFMTNNLQCPYCKVQPIRVGTIFY